MLLSMRVCVPNDWTNAQVAQFAERENPAGTSGGWNVHEDGPDPVRVDCGDRPGFVHIVLVV